VANALTPSYDERQGMPNEKGIVFSDWAIRAIQDGRKIQTRRIIKDDWWRCLDPDDDKDRAQAIEVCWYGPVGRRLYIKEAWAENDPPSGYVYRADCLPLGRVSGRELRHHREPTWGNPRFMPRKMARIFLAVTEIRIQKLQEISEADAIAEGVTIPYTDWTYGAAFEAKWREINGYKSWDANPWVFVIGFKKTK
jgi:hypothetical protein